MRLFDFTLCILVSFRLLPDSVFLSATQKEDHLPAGAFLCCPRYAYSTGLSPRGLPG